MIRGIKIRLQYLFPIALVAQDDCLDLSWLVTEDSVIIIFLILYHEKHIPVLWIFITVIKLYNLYQVLNITLYDWFTGISITMGRNLGDRAVKKHGPIVHLHRVFPHFLRHSLRTMNWKNTRSALRDMHNSKRKFYILGKFEKNQYLKVYYLIYLEDR